MPITVVATMYALEGKRDELLAEVLRVVPDVRKEDGCERYDPHTVGSDRIVLVESWASKESLRAHGEDRAREEFRARNAHLTARPTDIVIARPVEVPGPSS